MKKKIVFIILVYFQLNVYAQYYDSGQAPFFIKWKQISTATHTVLFPQSMEKKAKIYASYLLKISQTAGITLDNKPAKLPIIIYNSSVLSNGEVAWAPKRMNVYAVAPQDNANATWEQELLSHEYRHTVQISKLNKGFTKGLCYVFGEQTIGAILGLHVPKWFLEGDAVVFETASSLAGRGRNPDFSMKIKAQIAEKKIYSYSKAQYGSFKDFVPNYYELGYQLVARGREKYGVSLWSTVLDRVANVPISIRPFSFGIKKISGLPERKFYKNVLVNFQKEVSNKGINEKKIFGKITKPVKNDYVNYYNPTFYKDKIIAIKTSYNHIPKFVLIDTLGEERHLHTPGYLLNKTFSVGQNRIIWNEYSLTRWEKQNFSNIIIYNLTNKKLSRLTQKGRIFSSNLSPDATKIVSVEVSKNIDWSISVRDAANGEVLRLFVFDSIQPMQTSWLPDMQKIVFTAVGERGKSLGILSVENGEVSWILRNENIDFSQPKVFSNQLLIKAISNNVSNFFTYNLLDSTWRVLTNVNYGVGEGQLNANSLIFTDYTAEGFCVRKVSRDSLLHLFAKPERVYSSLLKILEKQEKQIKFSNLDTNFIVKKYSRFKNLINFHSWAPLAVRVEQEEVGLGISAMSQDALSTSFLSLGMQYHLQEEVNSFFLSYDYKGFFPHLKLKYNYIPRNFIYKYKGNNKELIKSHIHQMSVGVDFPFKWNKSSWNFGIEPHFYYNFDAIYFKRNDFFRQKKAHNFIYALSAYNFQSSSYRNLYPRWGQTVYLKYQHTPFDKGGELFVAKGRFYFPGLLSNQSLYFTTSFQKKEKGVFNYIGNVATARGYKMYENDEIRVVTANYSFPFLYPDLSVWELAYVKRLWANVFFDYAHLFYEDKNLTNKSLGVNVYANFHLFRLIVPMQIGVQYARKLDRKENYFGLLFTIDFHTL